jgi:hypothetical protein
MLKGDRLRAPTTTGGRPSSAPQKRAIASAPAKGAAITTAIALADKLTRRDSSDDLDKF